MSANRRNRQVLAIVEAGLVNIMERHPTARDHILVFYCQNGSSKLGLSKLGMTGSCRPDKAADFLSCNPNFKLAGILSLVDEQDGDVLASMPAGGDLELRSRIVEQMKNRFLEPPTEDQERAIAQEVLRLIEREASKN